VGAETAVSEGVGEVDSEGAAPVGLPDALTVWDAAATGESSAERDGVWAGPPVISAEPTLSTSTATSATAPPPRPMPMARSTEGRCI
jgi:hypothetical protein